MKTKYIKGTKKRYSIREDGIFTSHYKTYKNQYSSGIIYVEKILKYNKAKVVYTSNRVFFINSLLLEYFGKRICNRCNKNFKTKTVNIKVCDKCTKNRVRLKNKRWALRHPKQMKEIRRKYKAFQIESISDNYIRSELRMTKKDNLPEIILILKRNQLKLHRELKKQKKYDTN